jgi:Protein of unknown function (DUF664)
MTTSTDILIDGIARVRETSARVVIGLPLEHLEARVDPDANTICWLLWHIGRGQDAQVAAVAGTEQVWIAGGWIDRFDLPFGPSETGYAHTSAEVAQVRGVSAELLVDYISAVCDRTTEYLRSLSDEDLDRVVDTRWNPPVTLGSRIVSVISDDLQHAGQAAFVRGILERTGA